MDIRSNLLNFSPGVLSAPADGRVSQPIAPASDTVTRAAPQEMALDLRVVRPLPSSAALESPFPGTTSQASPFLPQSAPDVAVRPIALVAPSISAAVPFALVNVGPLQKAHEGEVFLTMIEATAPVATTPGVDRRPGEARIRWAQRLLTTSPHLGIDGIACLVGMPSRDIKREFARQQLTPELTRILLAFPPRSRESYQQFSDRLGKAYPDLRNEEIEWLAMARTPNPKRVDHAALSDDLQRVAQAVPKLPNEAVLHYARRLHRYDGKLTLGQIAQLSGATASNMRAAPMFYELTPRQKQVRAQLPRWPHEDNTKYARRVHASFPEFTVEDLAIVSGVNQTNVARYVLREEPRLTMRREDDEPALNAALRQAPPPNPPAGSPMDESQTT
ncbi:MULTISPECIES: hypothetical protein [Pandoraea]|uniref:hypothetical protein n=1 Tax=Pandoraea TaxID=93217 RepID=UPI001F5C9C4C|nr:MULTISPECIES: hypothetical protein [Pandoraea]